VQLPEGPCVDGLATMMERTAPGRSGVGAGAASDPAGESPADGSETVPADDARPDDMTRLRPLPR
jgi:hypothetical protein